GWSAPLAPVTKTRPKPVIISRPVPVPPLPESSVDALAAEAMPAPVSAELPAKAADELVASDEGAPEIVVRTHCSTQSNGSPAVSSGYELPDPHELLSDFSGPLQADHRTRKGCFRRPGGRGFEDHAASVGRRRDRRREERQSSHDAVEHSLLGQTGRGETAVD